jgi:hypothetical protein
MNETKYRLAESMLCWDEQTKDVKIVKWPDTGDQSFHYSSVGACSAQYRKWPKEKQMISIISEAIWLMEKKDIPIERMFAALMQIEECNDALLKDPFSNA